MNQHEVKSYILHFVSSVLTGIAMGFKLLARTFYAEEFQVVEFPSKFMRGISILSSFHD